MRKNRFLTFMFSIIPGCGHMYLGYMKRGVEFMAMFAASAYLSIICMNYSRGLEMVGAIFLMLLPIIWLYQMFDSMQTLSRMRILEITYPEDDGFFIPGISNITNINALNVFKKRSVIKGIAIILICVGVYVLFMNTSNGILQILLETARNNFVKRDMYTQIYYNIKQYVPSVVISLVLILGGIKLLKGSKNNQNNDNSNNNDGGGE